MRQSATEQVLNEVADHSGANATTQSVTTQCQPKTFVSTSHLILTTLGDTYYYLQGKKLGHEEELQN